MVPGTLRGTFRAAALLVAIFVLGTLGYALFGGPEHGWIDALYMTTITLTTVGYEETIAVREHPGLQLFTIGLLLTGAGTFVYFFSQLTAFLVEGNLDRLFWRRRMARRIAGLRDHYIVCGGGHTGEHVVAELLETDRPFVLVERSADRIAELQKLMGREFPAVEGDATEDEDLAAAAVERARGLVLCTNSDKDNLVAIFTARTQNPRIRIVARCQDDRTRVKLFRAGADSVVSPDRIGGLRLISEMVRPTVVSFLDLMMRDPQQRWRIEEVRVGEGSALDGTTVEALRASVGEDVLVVAVREADGAWAFNPGGSVLLGPQMGVVFMGSPAGRVALEERARADADATG